MHEARLSVVMSVYNAENYLHEAIESILNQTFSDFEFIIVNDGSKDSSLEIIESYHDERIVLVNQKNAGLPKALNKGIDKSKTNYIARMDADDISLPKRLEDQYKFMRCNPECVILGSNAIIIDMNGEYVFTTNNKITDNEIKINLPKLSFLHSSVMFKKDGFYAAGKYCESMLKGQDTVLFNRMVNFGKFNNIKEPLIKYRIVPTANSVKKILGKKYSEIERTAIQKNKISMTDRKYLESILRNTEVSERYSEYYIYLAKKYLWTNYNPTLSRRNLLLSYKKKVCFWTVGLYILTFFPEKFVQGTYCQLKRRFNDV